MRNNPADAKVSEGGGRRCSRRRSRSSPAAHGTDHGEAGCAPAAHGGPRWSRSPPAAHGGPHARAGGDAVMEVAAPGEEPMQEQAFWQAIWPVSSGRDEVL